MPDHASSQPSANRTSFAGMLAAFSGAQKEAPWDLTALADDVATISYEQALRTHRRARAEEPLERSIEPMPAVPATSTETTKAHKTASITFRLTAEEHALLQTRATEAGLSTSAYLRSCVFEAESLRAQVKEALLHMQSASPPTTPPAAAKAAPHNWHRRFFLPWSRGNKAET